MKWILFFLSLPFFTNAQTVHIEKGKVVYKGAVEISGIAGRDVYPIIKTNLEHRLGNCTGTSYAEDSATKEIVYKGMFKLSPSPGFSNKVQYKLKVTAKDGGYLYRIDEVNLVQKKRGENPVVIPSEDLVAKMDVNGPVSIQTEKILNEMDMNFQKILALLSNDVQAGLVK